MIKARVAFFAACGLGALLAACGGSSNSTPPAATHVLTVNSANPASGVAITASPADNNGAGSGTTSFTRTYNSGASVTLTAPGTSGNNTFSAWSGCTSASGATCTVTMNADVAVTAGYRIAPTVTVTPSASTVTIFQSLTVTVAVSGGAGAPAPTGSVSLTSGNYSSSAALSGGSATFTIAPGALPIGPNDVLDAAYTPDSASAPTYTAAVGASPLSVTDPTTTPTVAVAASPASVTMLQAFTVTVTLSGNPTPTGTVLLSSGTYTSTTVTSSSGVATFHLSAGALPAGTDALSAHYAPDTASSLYYNAATGTGSVAVTKAAPAMTVTPSPAGGTTSQAFTVTIVVNGGSGNPPATGSVTLASGSYNSGAATLSSGSATIDIPASTLPAGVDTLSASYTPDSAAAPTYSTATGTGSLTVTAPPKTTPTIAVTPSPASFSTAQQTSVTVAVSGGVGSPAPSGSVTLSSGSYSSGAVGLQSGSATIDIAAGALAAGNDTLTATYSPDAASLPLYNTATGTSPVTVIQVSTVTVNPSNPGIAVTNQILGMNMAAWYDPTTPAIVPAFATAGIAAMRWPGGSWSDDFHWQSNSLCNKGAIVYQSASNVSDANLIDDLVVPAGLDLALTANYGTNATCNGPGDPAEAAAWVTDVAQYGVHVSHMTVGNEEYGSWEDDLHAKKNDAATYASATVTGFYPAIKAADSSVLVGVVVNPGNTPEWDPIVLANAKGSYDFVEYHYYPQSPGQESDTYLVQQAAQGLTAGIDTIKSELAAAGAPNTPIYVGEIGSVYTNPGKQSTSITQALYAGQVLGETMSAGLSRLTWSIGFGGCEDSDFPQDGQLPNYSNSLYGWQTFGGYMVFSDGLPDYYGCTAAPTLAAGTLLPTARAFQLFGNVAVNGENVLTPTVAGDTTDVRAYAATHSGGTALVLFNVNENLSEQVTVRPTGKSSSSDVSIQTYSKAIYDQSQNNVWAPPATTDLGAQNLPLTLTLAPWSMNVVILK